MGIVGKVGGDLGLTADSVPILQCCIQTVDVAYHDWKWQNSFFVCLFFFLVFFAVFGCGWCLVFFFGGVKPTFMDTDHNQSLNRPPAS